MYSFVLSGVAPGGRQVIDRVRGATPPAAIDEFTGRGHTDVKLLADDPSRLSLSSAQTRERTTKFFTAREQARMASGTWSPLQTVGKIYRSALIPIALCLVIVVQRRAMGRPWSWVDAGLGAILMLPLVLLPLSGGRVRILHMVEAAGLAGDYERVLRLLPALAGAMAPMGKAAVDLHITTERAKALAGLGRLDEALAAMQALEDRPDIPRERYLLRLAEVYGVAGDREAALDCYEHAEQLSPGDAMAAIGKAEVLAVHLRRPAEAREALSRGRSLPIPENLRLLTGYIEGAIALDERRSRDALAALQQTIPLLEQHARRSPTAQGLLALVNALYAVALAESGNRTAAAEVLAKAEPILSRHARYGDLLARARSAAGRA